MQRSLFTLILEKMAVIINFYVKLAFFFFFFNFLKLCFDLRHELSVVCLQFMLPDNITIINAKIIKKSHFERNLSNRKVDNIIFEERSNQPWRWPVTWLYFVNEVVWTWDNTRILKTRHEKCRLAGIFCGEFLKF